MANEITIGGIEETQEMFFGSARVITDSVLEGVLVDGSKVIQRELRARSPRRATPIANEKREFERLEDSIVTDVDIHPGGLQGIARTGFGDSWPVALWNEYGHRIVTHDKRDTGKLTVPNPFMRQTADACREEVIDVCSASFQSRLRALYGQR